MRAFPSQASCQCGAGGLLLILDSIWQSSPEQQRRIAQRASPPWVALDLGCAAV